MKLKRLTAILSLLLCATTAASAGLAPLDEALSPLLDGRGAVSMSVQLAVKTLMPFDETRLDLINHVLRHARLNARIDLGADEDDTGFQITLGNQTLLEVTERRNGGAYLLQSSLLPNRMLFSAQRSPTDALLASSEAEPAEPESDANLNTSGVEEAFDMLSAVNELEGCYRALTDKIIPLTERKAANYNIEDIGKGRVSYVARLTTEQSGGFLNEIRAVISCGMDAAYRAELSAITFGSGFIVALYQNADEEDICVYMRGTIVYPDGDKRTLRWQWAFTPDRETQTFKHEAARESGTRDSRVINANLTRTNDGNGFTLEGKTVTNLRRSNLNETGTLTIDLAGDAGDALACKGVVKRVTEGTRGGESVGDQETSVTVDLSLAAAGDGSELTGTASYLEKTGNTVQMELELRFLPTSAAAANGPNSAENSAPAVVITVIPADPAVAQQAAETPATTAEEIRAAQPEFLVGTPPVGLYDYEIPAEPVTVDMDNSGREVHRSLMNEAAQRLAGNLVLAILDLPAEDRALLGDGMTEEDYAVFLAMLD